MSIKRHAVDTSLYHDYAPQDRVLTVEGLPGTVEAVQDGPGAGNEHYRVVLDNNLGGGIWSSGELSPLNASTQKQAAVATESYPELEDVLALKPPPPHSLALADYLAGLATGASSLYGAVTALRRHAADGGDHSGSAMVALALPPQVAEQTAVDGGVPAEQMHVTLAYLPHPTPEQIAATHQVVGNHATFVDPIKASVGGLGQFPAGDDGIPYYAPVDAPGDVLQALQGSLLVALKSAGVEVADDHGFTPHSTLTYLPEGEDAPDPIEPTSFEFQHLVVAQGPSWTHYPLGLDTRGFGSESEDTSISDDELEPEEVAASLHTADGYWSDMIHGRPGPAVNHDYCVFRHNQQCVFPKDLDVQATIQAQQARWVPVVRGHCGRNWEQQSQCPVSEAGPNARQLGVASKESGLTGDTVPKLILHLLPAHAEQAHSILQSEIAANQADAEPTVEALLAPNELINVIHKNGGFSVKDHVGDGPTGGYMVSKNKSTERAFPETGFGPDHIQGYLNEHQKELAEPNAYFGAWHDPESKKVYLDVSHHYPDFETAKQVGRQANQLGIYDIGEGKTVYLQGGQAAASKAFFRANADPHDVLDFLQVGDDNA